MTVELDKNSIKTLIGLITVEIERVGEAKEKYGFYDPGYFYKLVDIRSKLMAMPLAGELPSAFSNERW
ncbi:unnamed protein product [marine sediment metagenome]|uniref:Uncharacterized protein n=1 Tax=marine sediment metagenome TaxID=412755 RepID=X1GD34_9ZZZZ